MELWAEVPAGAALSTGWQCLKGFRQLVAEGSSNALSEVQRGRIWIGETSGGYGEISRCLVTTSPEYSGVSNPHGHVQPPAC